MSSKNKIHVFFLLVSVAVIFVLPPMPYWFGFLNGAFWASVSVIIGRLVTKK